MNPKRVLVADDEPHMARVIELFLRREGYEVEIVPNGKAALDRILKQPPDVLITDINMPGMTGEALCAELQERLPDRVFMIVIMTSMTNREHREWPQKMRDTHFLEKPLSMRALVAMLDKHFEKPPAGSDPRHG